jgi:hypothetical protein
MASTLGFLHVDVAFASHSLRRGAIVDATNSKLFTDSNIEIFFRFSADCWKSVYAKAALVTLVK